MTIIVGITGGIGSGKSTFSNEVTKRGYCLLDSDVQVANIYNNPTNHFLNYLKKINLGNCINKRKINKKNISKHIFFNGETKKKLENYIFRIVRPTCRCFTAHFAIISIQLLLYPRGGDPHAHSASILSSFLF